MLTTLIPTLKAFDIDPVHGFLPTEEPLERLPEEFAPWEQIVSETSALLMSSRLRSTLDTLPILDASKLEDDRQLRRAMLVLSIFANGYVWADDVPITHLPRGIAMPLWQVAEKLGRPPILSHASIVLDNWRRLNPEEPIALGNIATLQLFLGGLDEQWFYLATVAVEAEGAPALKCFLELYRAIATHNPTHNVPIIAQQLHQIHSILVRLQNALSRITERCDPYIFYHRVRPFLAGWPEPGIIYEGVQAEPVKLAGGSAAQSSLIQSFDAVLGVKHHQGETNSFLLSMRSYMPPLHRKFIEFLESELNIRDYVLKHMDHYPELCTIYNDCVQELGKFRKAHMEIAAHYILRQSPQAGKGTGGTNFVSFLKKVENETKANLIATKA